MDGTDLIMNGEIILEGDVLPHDYCEWRESGCFSARMVREALNVIEGNVTVRVNSAGGSPHEGEAIRAAFEAHSGEVLVVVGGIAASAASLMIMSADRIEMTAGSFLMMHRPSACVCGESSVLRSEADALDQLAMVYAAVYAQRSGQTADEVLQMMADTTWLGPEQAVAQGFADAVVGTAEASEEVAGLAAAQSLHSRAIATFQMCITHFKTEGSMPLANQAGAPGQPQVTMTANPEKDMDPEEAPAVAPTAATPEAGTPPPSTPTQMAASAQEATQAAVQAERNRAREIRTMSAPFCAAGSLTNADVDAAIEQGLSVDAASTRFMGIMATAEGRVPAAPRGDRMDETDTQVEGLIQAMMGRFDGPGQQYRGMRVRDLAMHLGGSTGFDRTAAIRSGMVSTTMMGGAHGVSDFAYITGEVMNRSLMAEYERRGANWQAVTGTPMNATDFREIHAVRFGGDFQLKEVEANGEYAQAVLDDEAEGLKVERRGRTIKLTFEAVINDDMGAFQRIPREFAMAARVMENKMVWSIFRGNAVLKSDGVALFHSTHKNLAASGAALSAATVAAGRKAMWEQAAFKTKDPDDFLQIEADQLIVPPAQELTALQFTAATAPTSDGEVNPYKSTLTAVTIPNIGAAAGGSDTAWYLVSSDYPPISVAYLDGYQAPTVQTLEGMNPDCVMMNARHIFGAAPTEFRGSWKNPGA